MMNDNNNNNDNNDNYNNLIINVELFYIVFEIMIYNYDL